MKPEIERAMREVLEAWETPDSPEALACAIYQMKRTYMAAVVDSLSRKKPGRPRKHSRHNDLAHSQKGRERGPDNTQD